MKDKVELEIAPDGTIRTMYQEGIEQFADALGGEISTSCRASDVEWEDDGTHKGWTVRSAYDKELAIRWKFNTEPREDGKIRFPPLDLYVSKEGGLVFFPTREEALKEEVKFFWELLAPNRERNGTE